MGRVTKLVRRGYGWYGRTEAMSERSSEWPVVPCGTNLAVRAGRDFQVEDVGSLALVEDEEDLGEMAVACGGFKVDDLVDARF